MSLGKKEIREITGFTFLGIGKDPETWISRARAFKSVAELIVESNEYSPPFPF